VGVALSHETELMSVYCALAVPDTVNSPLTADPPACVLRSRFSGSALMEPLTSVRVTGTVWVDPFASNKMYPKFKGALNPAGFTETVNCWFVLNTPVGLIVTHEYATETEKNSAGRYIHLENLWLGNWTIRNTLEVQ